ncbi:hypothetical protein [Bacillus sp. JCM 19034]|uniref:hypothetical protein n=1 Tax=Bacillus sp. JCM 19034 TaxID=1481928 RepID=UPI00078514A5|nr:hypothetical protein [Bacillus sp. JCM 19034]
MFYWLDGYTKEASPYVNALRQLYPIEVEQTVKVAEALCQVGDYEQAYQRLKGIKRSVLETKPSALCCLGIAAYYMSDPNTNRIFKRAAKLGDEQAEQIVNGELAIQDARSWKGSF